MMALAALGADRTQMLGARPTGRRGEIALPESEQATAAFAELQPLLGAASAQAMRRSGIRARAAISREAWPQTGVSRLFAGTSPVISRTEVPRATAANRQGDRHRLAPLPDSPTNAEAGRGVGHRQASRPSPGAAHLTWDLGSGLPAVARPRTGRRLEEQAPSIGELGVPDA